MQVRPARLPNRGMNLLRKYIKEDKSDAWLYVLLGVAIVGGGVGAYFFSERHDVGQPRGIVGNTDPGDKIYK